MSTERKVRGKSRWLMPLWLALPILLLIAAAVILYGPRLAELINVAIKGTVVS